MEEHDVLILIIDKKLLDMKFIPFFLILIFQSTCHNNMLKRISLPIYIGDTLYLKKLDWIPLHEGVSYHIVKKHDKNDRKPNILLSTVTIYSYSSGQYSIQKDTGKIMTDKEIEGFIMSKLIEEENIDECFIKMNSKFFYEADPSLLNNIFIFIYEDSEINSLNLYLKDRPYVQSTNIIEDTEENPITHQVSV